MKNYDTEREAVRADKWAAMEKEVGGALGAEVVEAFRELYDLYSPEVIDWFAGLYDHKTGGYYYSQSARDNESVEHRGEVYLLRPDIESTWQALGFVSSSGMADDLGGSYSGFMPDWMKRDVLKYITECQDPDGFYYEPQWGKRISNSRRSRDTAWAGSVLKTLGVKPKYKNLTNGAAGAEKGEMLIPDHLSSLEKFKKYLDSLDVDNLSYPAGNTLCSQAGQLKALGLIDYCIDYLNAHQKENGLWQNEENYFAVNGLMKISGIYEEVGRELPRAERAVAAAMRAITSSEPVRAGVDIYNPWFAIGNVKAVYRAAGEDGERRAREITAVAREMAPEAIRATKAKVALFEKEMGSFSYGLSGASPTSQGQPVCIPGLPEGDINGHIISSVGAIGHVLRTLDLADQRPPLFIKKDRLRYLELLEAGRK